MHNYFPYSQVIDVIKQTISKLTYVGDWYVASNDKQPTSQISSPNIASEMYY